MGVFERTTPDGKTYQVELPDDATTQDVDAALVAAGIDIGEMSLATAPQRFVYGANRGLGLGGTSFAGSGDLGTAGEAGRTFGQAVQGAAALIPATRALLGFRPFLPGFAATTAAPTTVAQNVAASIARPLSTKSGAIAELAAAAGAAAGTATAVEADIEDPTARAALEIGGAVAAQGPLMQLAAPAFKSTIYEPAKKLYANLTRSDALTQQMAGSLVRDVVDDPDSTLTALRSAEERGAQGTAFQATADPKLAGIEKYFIDRGKGYGARVAQITKSEFRRQNALINSYRNQGDPINLAKAMVLRYQQYESFLDDVVGQAEAAARRAGASLTPNQQGQIDLSTKARSEIDKAFAIAKKQEGALYDRINKTQTVEIDSLLPFIKDVQATQGIPGSPVFDPNIKRAIKIASKKKKGKTLDNVGFLLNLRKEVRRQQSNFSDDPNTRAIAQRYGALKNEIDEILLTTGQKEISDAFAFSTARNEAFTRSIIGRIRRPRKLGEAPIRPGETFSAVFSGDFAKQKANVDELLQSTAPIGGGEPSGTMLNLTQQFMRGMASNTLNPNTGAVDPQRLAKFQAENAALLQSFPQLASQIETAKSAQALLDQMKADFPNEANKMQQRIFGEVIGRKLGVAAPENPQRFVKRALDGDAPNRNYFELIRTARRGGRAAMDGLKDSVMEWAFNKGGQNVDALQILGALNQRFGRDGPSVIDNLVNSKIMTPKERDGILGQLNELKRFQEALGIEGGLSEELVKENPIFDVFARVLGANLASVGVVGEAAPLVAGYAGSRLARETLQYAPNERIKNAIMEASLNPRLMADLLETGIQAQLPQGGMSFAQRRRSAADQYSGIVSRFFVRQGALQQPFQAAAEMAQQE